jgi:PAS domain-containing protein
MPALAGHGRDATGGRQRNMRDNGPVTTREITVPETEMLVSRTDAGGRIIFCNGTFAAVSGFANDELLGAPHNLVRHPDMPQAAFRNLWETIRAGQVWEGLVKNRTKAGRFLLGARQCHAGGRAREAAGLRLHPRPARARGGAARRGGLCQVALRKGGGAGPAPGRDRLHRSPRPPRPRLAERHGPGHPGRARRRGNARAAPPGWMPPAIPWPAGWPPCWASVPPPRLAGRRWR